MCQERKPHKHAELIKAWADGAEIQEMNYAGKWVDIGVGGAAICWSLRSNYRIKPKDPIVRYIFAGNNELYWYRENESNIKLTLDPDTFDIISVEKI